MVMMDMIRQELLRARKESELLESLRRYAELFAEQATSRRKLGVGITARLAACDAERVQLEHWGSAWPQAKADFEAAFDELHAARHQGELRAEPPAMGCATA